MTRELYIMRQDKFQEVHIEVKYTNQGTVGGQGTGTGSIGLRGQSTLELTALMSLLRVWSVILKKVFFCTKLYFLCWPSKKEQIFFWIFCIPPLITPSLFLYVCTWEEWRSAPATRWWCPSRTSRSAPSRCSQCIRPGTCSAYVVITSPWPWVCSYCASLGMYQVVIRPFLSGIRLPFNSVSGPLVTRCLAGIDPNIRYPAGNQI